VTSTSKQEEGTDGGGVFVFGRATFTASPAPADGAGFSSPQEAAGLGSRPEAPCTAAMHQSASPFAFTPRARKNRGAMQRRVPRPAPHLQAASGKHQENDGGTTVFESTVGSASAAAPTNSVGAGVAAAPPQMHKASAAMGRPEQVVPAQALAKILAEARGHIGEQRFAPAARACLQALSGPGALVGLLEEALESMESADRGHIREHEDERRSLMAQLIDARERSAQFGAERKRRQEAESAAAALRQELQREREASARQREEAARERARQRDEAARESARLRKQLHAAEQMARAPPSRDDVVGTLARLECEPLRSCSSQDRASLKKRLLLKWHPDKQPSVQHVDLSKMVMQELQNREEWSW